MHRLIYDIEAERTRNEQCIDSILRAEKSTESSSSADDSSHASQQVTVLQLQTKTYFLTDLKKHVVLICSSYCVFCFVRFLISVFFTNQN